MEFRKYSGIYNSYNNKFIDQIRDTIGVQNTTDEFVAFEKLHGANVQIHTYEQNGVLIYEYGRRGAIL